MAEEVIFESGHNDAIETLISLGGNSNLSGHGRKVRNFSISLNNNILPAAVDNPDRIALYLLNAYNSADVVYVQLGQGSQGISTVILLPGDSFLIDLDFPLTTSVFVACNTTASVLGTEISVK